MPVRLVDVVLPVPTQLWDDVAAHASVVLPGQTSTWRDCIVDAGRKRDLSRMYVFDDGVRVIVPLAGTRTGPPQLTRAASWPFDWGIGGPLNTPGLTDEHVAIVYDELHRAGFMTLQVRVAAQSDRRWWQTPAGWTTSTSAQWEAPLLPDFQQIWERSFKRNIRAGVKRAESSGVTIESDSSGRLLPVYFELFDHAIARWSRLQHEPLRLTRWRNYRANPPEKIRLVDQKFGEHSTVWVARVDGRPASAALVISLGPYVRYWRGAMNEHLAGPARANHLLHCRIIERACGEGGRLYQMGDALPGTGLARFKSELGGQQRDALTVVHERVPLNAVDRRARALVKAAIGFRDRR